MIECQNINDVMMKKSILSLVVLCLIQFVNAQDRKVLNTVDSTSVVLEYDRNDGVKVDLFGEGMWINKLHYLLKLNVCEYYDLKDYDTDLKRKVFKESSEGVNLLKGMRTLRQKVMNSKGYYLFNFKDNWGGIKAMIYKINSLSSLTLSGIQNIQQCRVI